MATLLHFEDVHLGYLHKTILRDINLAIVSGEILTVIGPNGSGKSSLLRASIGEIGAIKGKITRSKDLRLGYVPQKISLDPSFPMSVGRFLRLSNANNVESLLARVGLEQHQSASLSSLSGGQLQRVLLARALAREPNLLLLDEPTQGLDQIGAAKFYALIETLRQETGCAIVMASHDLHVVMSSSDRVICLNGHICCQGNPATVASAPEYRALFGFGTQGNLALYQHHHDHEHGLEDKLKKRAVSQ